MGSYEAAVPRRALSLTPLLALSVLRVYGVCLPLSVFVGVSLH